ncbi:MAG: sigma-70 family RNA polymerase sigma factor, partial [Bacteroidota bacterium]
MNPGVQYTEAELVNGCQEGKPIFQRALYNRYYRLMYGICLRYAGNKDEAQDILQEGFIKVFRHINGFRSEGSLEGWVRRIVVRTAIEHYRKNSRFFPVELEAARDLSDSEDVISDLSRQELLQVIQGLPPGFRTVFNLYVIEGYTHREIGEMLGISEGTSKSQFSRSR